MPPKSRTGAGAKKVRRKEKKNVAHGHAHIKSTFNNTIVSITDPTGQRDLLGLRRPGGLQGLAQVDAVRRADGRRGRRPSRAGARHAQGRRLREGPGLGPRDRDPFAAGRRPRGRDDPGRHPRRRTTAAARPSAAGSDAEEKETHGSLHRCGLQALPSREDEAVPQGHQVRRRRSARSRSVPTRPGSTAAAAPRRASTCCRCARSRRPAASTACSRSSSAATTRRPTASRARPVRTCCGSSSRGSTTSSTAPASPSRRDMARQLVRHGHFLVNGKKVDIPSYRVSEHDIVEVRAEVASS